MGPEDRRDFVVRLDADRLGRYRATVVKPAVYANGTRTHAPARVTSKRMHTSKEDAIAAVDAHLVSQYASLLPLLQREQSWHERHASEKQIRFLKRLGARAVHS